MYQPQQRISVVILFNLIIELWRSLQEKERATINYYIYTIRPEWNGEKKMQRQWPTQAEGTLSAFNYSKPCKCQKSHCLNGYCKCFASGVLCCRCNCMNCSNDKKHERERHKAVKLYLGRKANNISGCNCKRSSCVKNYCECFEAGIKCSISCTCDDCWNYRIDIGVMSAQETRSGPVITSAVVEAVCSSLLVQAKLAENVNLTAAQVERLVLKEFGQFLTQIKEAMFSG